eukprot:COSAG02_NODE_84_length_39615_cov_144.775256_3_plen_109_part_00
MISMCGSLHSPLKPPLLATMKSNNYLLNALVAMHAERCEAHNVYGSRRFTFCLLSPCRRRKLNLTEVVGCDRAGAALGIQSDGGWITGAQLVGRLAIRIDTFAVVETY